jgi:ABC-type tungstate transport system substrate-binding protein
MGRKAFGLKAAQVAAYGCRVAEVGQVSFLFCLPYFLFATLP